MSEDRPKNQEAANDVSSEGIMEPAALAQETPQNQEAVPQPQEKPIVLWKDWKFLSGFMLVFSSIILGFFAKWLIVINITEPFRLIRALSVYGLSWALLFIGIFLVGMETVKVIRQRINHHVRRTVKGTYHYTKRLPKESYEYTKKLHKKGIDGLAKTSSFIKGKMRKEHA